jgi:hypothetical protein
MAAATGMAISTGDARRTPANPRIPGRARGSRQPSMRGQDARISYRKELPMGIILLVLLLALILGGLGFAVHILWWIALIVLVLWLVGFVVRAGEGTSRGRWYRW